MEYAELASIWENYDNKLDNLEKLNKRLIKETLLKKPKRKLNLFKFKGIESMIVFPLAMLILLYPNFRAENIDWKFITGCLFVLTIVVYAIYINIKTVRALNNLDLENDSALDSTRKSAKIRDIFKSRYTNARINLPILYIGIIMVKWNDISFNTGTIIFIVVLFIVLFFYNIKGPKIHRNMIEKWEKDIHEFNEFVK